LGLGPLHQAKKKSAPSNDAVIIVTANAWVANPRKRHGNQQRFLPLD